MELILSSLKDKCKRSKLWCMRKCYLKQITQIEGVRLEYKQVLLPFGFRQKPQLLQSWKCYNCSTWVNTSECQAKVNVLLSHPTWRLNVLVQYTSEVTLTWGCAERLRTENPVFMRYAITNPNLGIRNSKRWTQRLTKLADIRLKNNLIFAANQNDFSDTIFTVQGSQFSIR